MAQPVHHEVEALLERLDTFDKPALVLNWRNHLGGDVPDHLPRWLLARLFAYRLQVAAYGGLDAKIVRGLKRQKQQRSRTLFDVRPGRNAEGQALSPGTILIREWQGELQRVTVMRDGFAWRGENYASLSRVANAITGTNWNGHRFFGLQRKRGSATVQARSRRSRTAAGATEVPQLLESVQDAAARMADAGT